MAQRYTAVETLEFLLRTSEEEDNAASDEIEGDTSEEEDLTEAEPHMDSEEEDTEEEGPVTYTSKNGEILWQSSPPLQKQGRARAEEIRRNTAGPTRYTCTRVEDIRSAFELFFAQSIQNIILVMTNIEGKRVCGSEWTDVVPEDLRAFFGLLILAGVFKSNHEATRSLWDSDFGRSIFRATMSLKMFHMLSRVVRFDDKSTRQNDKLAPVREIWDKWVERLPLIYNPDVNVTVDECLVPFRGRCAFKQYIPSKPAKYGLKIWAACDSATSYCWNMQIYTGKPAGGQPERNQGKRVVLDITQGLQGHIVTCDNFFTSYDLGTELLQRKIRMLGTGRRNKPELPNSLTNPKGRAQHSSLFAFTETHTIVSYCPKKKKKCASHEHSPQRGSYR